jgi:hypothetical protein
MTTRRRSLTAALGAGVVAVLGACTSLPTSGPVQVSNVHVSEAPDVDVLAQGPQPGADQHSIVEAFLLAQAAGFADNFAVARQYLAGDARAAWKPLAGVVVGSEAISVPRDGEVTVDVAVSGRVDANGVYVEAAPGAHETLTFDMRQDASKEWRISAAPDGLLLSPEFFQLLYRPTPVYFLSTDRSYLVPDTRWLPSRSQSLPTAVMDALIAGPADWLRDGVVTELPDGVQLKPESVVIDEKGRAKVHLGPVASVTKANRPLLVAQIQASLTALPGVLGVDVDSGGVPLESNPTPPQGGAGVAATSGPLTFLANGKLMQLDGAAVSEVRGIGSLEGLNVSAQAVGPDGTRVMLSGGTALVTAPAGTTPAQTLLSAPQLLTPSVDRFGWAWTSDGTNLLAAHVGQPPVSVRADWLANRVVRSVRVAADGARVAVVSAGNDGVEIDVAVVTRDDAGVPHQLGNPVRAGASLTDATQVVWTDEATLGVLGRTPTGSPIVNLVPVAGPTVVLPQVADAVALAGGQPLVVAAKDGTLWRFQKPTWVAVPGVAGASDPAYPG